MLLTVANREELLKLISEKPKLIVAFVSSTCGACQASKPKIEQLANSHDVVKIDLREQPDIETGIRSVPLFRVYRSGKLSGEVLGYQESQILSHLQESAALEAIVKPLVIGTRRSAALDLEILAKSPNEARQNYSRALVYLSMAAILSSPLLSEISLFTLQRFRELPEKVRENILAENAPQDTRVTIPQAYKDLIYAALTNRDVESAARKYNQLLRKSMTGREWELREMLETNLRDTIDEASDVEVIKALKEEARKVIST